MNASRMASALLTALLLISTASAAPIVGNHTRWNDQLEACVYFYQLTEKAGWCYVDVSECIVSPQRPNTFTTIALTECKPYEEATLRPIVPQPNRPPYFKRPA